ncbi:oligopeptide transporter, OPT family [bacterium]|nr:oligopeptide transporter, OPT family [bacterium]
MKSGGFKPYVPEKTDLRELTFKAVSLGVLMAIVLGAANAYLGLRAGITIAATFPAAVVGMAFLRLFKGSILEENIARTTASVGEALVAGAIFTIPAFLIAGVWKEFGTTKNYIIATSIMLIGGIIGVLFLTVLRRILVYDASLPFPESVATAEIHKAGRTGGTGAKYLFGAMGLAGLIEILAKFHVFAVKFKTFIPFAKTGVGLNTVGGKITIGGGGGIMAVLPAISPAYFGVGYIIGPRIAALNFSGGLLAWGLMIPLLMFLFGPQFAEFAGTDPNSWIDTSMVVWTNIVRPIAVGGMLCGVLTTLWKIRKQLIGGVGHAIADLKKSSGQKTGESRFDIDISFKWVLPAIGVGLLGIIAIYNYFCGNLVGAIAAAIVMIIAGFFFSAIAGYLVGILGSSNNPISGLTISTLIIAALLMLLLGVSGMSGIAATLGVAAVVCCMCGVAGDMLQDLKTGYILGGTPWKMEVGEIIGVVFAALIMFFPLWALHQGDINAGGIGFGGENLPAPQAGLMAMLSKGIITGQMAWPLVIVGFFMGIVLVLMGVKSPVIVAVGMYLPIYTTFAIFVGGVIKGIVQFIADKKKLNEAQKVRVENNGILIASGLIAGEALVGVLIALLYAVNLKIPHVFEDPSHTPIAIFIGLAVMVLIALVLIKVPLGNAGRKDEPAPPSVS